MKRSNWAKLIALIVSLMILLVILLGWMLSRAIYTANKNMCENRAKIVASSLKSYCNSNDYRLPPRYIENKQTGNRHSWRVLLFPFYGYDSVYGKYRFHEPWNSPQNQELANCNNFACPAHSTSPVMTNYVAVVGENTLWPAPKKPAEYALYDYESDEDDPGQYEWPVNRGRKIGPDCDSKIVLIELVQSDIPWMEPRDITLDEFLDTIKKNPEGPFYNKYVKGIRAIDASGNLRVIDPHEDRNKIREMFEVKPEKDAVHHDSTDPATAEGNGG